MTGAKLKKRILVGEDEKPMAKALKLKLEGEGYQVDNAYDGEEVVSLMKNNKYDLVLLDVMMPKVDGYKALEALKKAKIKVPPTIMLSNLSQQEDTDKAISLGAVDFLIKSNTPISQVVKKIESYL